MNFSQWLTNWLTRHPLKEPAKLDQAAYTAEVMQRVKDIDTNYAGACPKFRLGERLRNWGLAPDMWPQAGLSWAAVAVGLVVAVWGFQAGGSQLAQRRIAEDAELLARLDEPVNGILEQELVDEAVDLDSEELLRLAEAPADDEAWVTETLQLLDKLEETPEDGTSPEGASEEEWLEELEVLDDNEMAASS